MRSRNWVRTRSSWLVMLEFSCSADDDARGIAQINSKQKEIGPNVGHDGARLTARRTLGARLADVDVSDPGERRQGREKVVLRSG